MPSDFVLCVRVKSAIEAHLRLVLDQYSVDLTIGTDNFSFLPARAEPQTKKAGCCNGSW